MLSRAGVNALVQAVAGTQREPPGRTHRMARRSNWSPRPPGTTSARVGSTIVQSGCAIEGAINALHGDLRRPPREMTSAPDKGDRDREDSPKRRIGNHAFLHGRPQVCKENHTPGGKLRDLVSHRSGVMTQSRAGRESSCSHARCKDDGGSAPHYPRRATLTNDSRLPRGGEEKWYSLFVAAVGESD